MAEYRAFILGEDGRVKWAVPLDCPDDETAKKYAQRLVDGRDVDLWQLDRKVESFKFPRH